MVAHGKAKNECSLCGYSIKYSNRLKDRICSNINCVYGCVIPNNVEKYRYKCYTCKLKNAHVVSYTIDRTWYHIRLIQCEKCFKNHKINDTSKRIIINKIRKGEYDRELKVFYLANPRSFVSSSKIIKTKRKKKRVVPQKEKKIHILLSAPLDAFLKQSAKNPKEFYQLF